jgi:hypothetical protein
MRELINELKSGNICLSMAVAKASGKLTSMAKHHPNGVHTNREICELLDALFEISMEEARRADEESEETESQAEEDHQQSRAKPRCLVSNMGGHGFPVSGRTAL